MDASSAPLRSTEDKDYITSECSDIEFFDATESENTFASDFIDRDDGNQEGTDDEDTDTSCDLDEDCDDDDNDELNKELNCSLSDDDETDSPKPPRQRTKSDPRKFNLSYFLYKI